jgi:hypothetical protein
MKYTVRKSYVEVLGITWMPRVPGATRIDVSSYDIGNLRDDDGKITRESVDLWLGCHSGDFSEVTDFAASIEDGEETIDISWSDEDNEMEYMNLMYPEEDD